MFTCLHDDQISRMLALKASVRSEITGQSTMRIKKIRVCWLQRSPRSGLHGVPDSGVEIAHMTPPSCTATTKHEAYTALQLRIHSSQHSSTATPRKLESSCSQVTCGSTDLGTDYMWATRARVTTGERARSAFQVVEEHDPRFLPTTKPGLLT